MFNNKIKVSGALSMRSYQQDKNIEKKFHWFEDQSELIN